MTGSNVDLPSEVAHVKAPRLVSYTVAGILIVSGVLSALTAGLLPSGGGPDERAHYSYVQHLAREPLPFPPRFEDVYTGDGTSPNHLMHPPAYHYLMAVAYRALRVDQQLTSVGLQADAHGGLTSTTMITPLRMASLPLVALHLLGLYRLLHQLIGRRIIPAWTAIPLAAASSWVPSTIFISGTLNNDVLLRAVWPWLALAVIQYAHTGRPRFLWASTTLVSLGILTKGTFWPLAATAATICMIAFWKHGAVAPLTYVSARGATARDTWGRRLPAAVAVVSAGAALWYLLAMVMRYGSPQPSYHSVFGIPVRESQFYRASVADRGDHSFTTIARAVRRGVEDMVGSFVGVLGQQERMLAEDARSITLVLVILAAITLAATVWGLAPSQRSSRSMTGAALIVVALMFAVTYVLRSWRTFQVLGNFGAQGRYLIGYIDLWLIGSVALGWHYVATRGTRAVRIAAASVLAALLLLTTVMLARPMYYFTNSVQLHDRVGVDRLVAEAAEGDGFLPLTFDSAPGSPATTIPLARSGRILPEGSWALSSNDAAVMARLPNEVSRTGCLAVRLHTRNVNDAVVELRLVTVPTRGVIRGTEARTLSLDQGIEVTDVVMPRTPDNVLVLRPAPGSGGFDLLQGFAGDAPCP